MRWIGNRIWLLGLLAFIFTAVGTAQATVNPAASDSIPKATAPIGFHYVQKGDTYYRLSRLYQVPVDSLQAWNGPNLQLGATIRVKPDTGTKANIIKQIPPAEVVKKTPVPPAPVNQEPQPEAQPGTPEKEAAYTSPKTVQRVVVIPFDPALYFSDADNDIAWQSKIPKQNVRYVFRQRLTALLNVPGYQTINLLGGVPGSDDELARIYKGLNYSYQDITYTNFTPIAPPKEKGLKAWVKNTKTKVGLQAPTEPISVANDERKYYGVQLKDPALLAHLNQTHQSDYYLFLNQFEIFTDYTNCIDRTTQNFLRNFRVHYSIFNAKGELVAGSKVLIPYVSNVNDVDIIVRENLGKMATRILDDMPRPQPLTADGLAN